MNRIAQALSLLLILLSVPVFSAQLAPADQEIVLRTRVGYAYIHQEGSNPDWRAGTLGVVEITDPVVRGTGLVQRFRAQHGKFHVVREIADDQPAQQTEPQQVRVRIDTRPEGIAQGLAAVLRRIDATKKTTLSQDRLQIAGDAIEVPTGEYTVEFPQVNGYRAPGKNGVAGRYRLQDTSKVQLLIGEYAILPGQASVRFTTDSAFVRLLDQLKVRVSDPTGKAMHMAPLKPVDGTVMLSDLAAGPYTLDVTVPEQYFHPVPKQPIVIQADQTVAISTPVQPRFAAADIAVAFDTPAARSQRPTITIVDAEGNAVVSDQGRLTTQRLVPGEYTVTFQEIEGFQAPSAITFTARPGVAVQPQLGTYRSGRGGLAIDYGVGEAHELIDSVAIWVTDSLGTRTAYPRAGSIQQKSSAGTKKILIENITEGEYTVTAEASGSDGLFEIPAPVKVKVGNGQLAKASLQLQPRFASIVAETDIPKGQPPAEMRILDSSGREVASGTGLALRAEHLFPGDYTVVFGDHPVLSAPASIKVTLAPGEEKGPIRGSYREGSGGMLVDYSVGDAVDRLSRVRFWLVDSRGQRTMYPNETTPGKEIAPGRKQVHVEGVSAGEYTIEFAIPNSDGLFGAANLQQQAVVIKGQQALVEVRFDTQFGSLSAVAVTPADAKSGVTPKIVLRDNLGKVVLTQAGRLAANRLSPGEYTIEFERIDPWVTPQTQKILVTPGRNLGLILGEYTISSGSLEANLTLPKTDAGNMPMPTLRLVDSKGEVVSSSGNGQLTAAGIPAGEYSLEIRELDGTLGMRPTPVTIRTGERTGPIEIEYIGGRGELELQCVGEKRLYENVDFSLVGPDGIFQSLKPDATGYVLVENLPAGDYTVETHGSLASSPTPPPQRIHVGRGQTAEVTLRFETQNGGIEAMARLITGSKTFEKTPTVRLLRVDGTLVTESTTGYLIEGRLPPGDYELHFESVDGLDTPAPQLVTVEPRAIAGPFYGDYARASGGLEVTYSTGGELDALNEVHFWLTDKNGNRNSYPENGRYTDDTRKTQRTVKISELASGTYEIEFFVPEKDGLFAPVPKQKVTVESGRTAQISQSIEPRYGSVAVAADLKAIAGSVQPMIIVRNAAGKAVAQGRGDALTADKLVPGKYTVEFSETADLKTPAPRTVQVQAGRTANVRASGFQMASGRLKLSYRTGARGEMLDQVKVRLTGPNTDSILQPKASQARTGELALFREVEVDQLLVGEYTVTMEAPESNGLFQENAESVFNIERDQQTTVDLVLQPHYGSLEANVELPAEGLPERQNPEIRLFDEMGNKQGTSQSGKLLVDSLVPGKYKVEFEPIAGAVSPEPVFVTVLPDQASAPVTGTYAIALGSLAVNYVVPGEPELADKITFTLTTKRGSVAKYPSEAQKPLAFQNGEREIQLKDLPEGAYTLSFQVPFASGLLSAPAAQTIHVKGGDVVRIHQEFSPQYGGVYATLNFPGAVPPSDVEPSIQVEDLTGRIVATSKGDTLDVKRIAPGTYKLVASPTSEYLAPASLPIDVVPNKVSGPHVLKYKQGEGQVRVTFDTGEKGDRLDLVQLHLTDRRGTVYKFTSTDFEKNQPFMRTLLIRHVPLGQYELKFLAPNDDGLFASLPVERFVVTQDNVIQVRTSLTPRYASLEVAIVVPDPYRTRNQLPEITLRGSQGRTVLTSTTGQLASSQLPPGTYTVDFASVPKLSSPDPVTVTLAPGESASPIVGTYSASLGTVQVTYRVSGKGDYLKDVCFWLANDRNEKVFYPRANDEILNHGEFERTVVIRDLPTGAYRVAMDAPNADGLFGTLPEQTFVLAAGETASIDFTLNPTYGSLEASVILPDELSAGAFPEMTLSRARDQEVVAHSTSGFLAVENLVPGEYIISYGPLSDYTTPAAQNVTVLADKKVIAPPASYNPATGTLVLRYNTGPSKERLDKVRFWLVDRNNRHVSPPTDADRIPDPQSDGYVVTLPNLPVGEYELEWHIPNADGLFGTVPPQRISVVKNETSEVLQSFVPRFGSLDIAVRLPATADKGQRPPRIFVLNAQGERIFESATGTLRIERLVPERYTVQFEELPEFDTPAQVDVVLQPDEQHERILGAYLRASGQLEVTYSTGPTRERLDQVGLHLRTALGDAVNSVKPTKDFLTDRNAYRAIYKGLPVGDYTLSFDVPNHDALFERVPDQSIVMRKGQNVTIEQIMLPQWASIEALAQLPADLDPADERPSIVLKDPSGKVIESSSSGRLFKTNLYPGSYQLVFTETAILAPPAPQQLELKPGAASGPIVGEYRRTLGSLVASFQTGSEGDRLDAVEVELHKASGELLHPDKRFVQGAATPGLGREVLFKDLPTGEYVVFFRVPNEDNLFAEPEKSYTAVVRSGETAIIQHQFNPQYGGLNILTKMAKPVTQRPWVTVTDRTGRVVARSQEADMTVRGLIPDYYTVSFEALDGFVTPSDLSVWVTPNTVVGPYEPEYLLAVGKVVFEYYTNPQREYMDQIRVGLVNPAGVQSTFPLDEGVLSADVLQEFVGVKQRITVDNVPTGTYTVRFQMPDTNGLLPEVADQQIVVALGQTVRIEQPLRPRYGGIEAQVKLPAVGQSLIYQPTISLRDSGGNVVAKSEDGYLLQLNLRPGVYTLDCEQHDLYADMPARTLTIDPNEVEGPFVIEYLPALGNLELMYSTDTSGERLADIRVWLVDGAGTRTELEPQQEKEALPYRRILVENLRTGDYTLEFYLPNADGLFEPAQPQVVSVHKKDTTHVVKQFQPLYGGIEASISFSDKIQRGRGLVIKQLWGQTSGGTNEVPLPNNTRLPRIVIRDANGQEVDRTEAGKVLHRRLPPGEYDVSFEDVEYFETPTARKVTVKANEVTGPIVHEYQPAEGGLVVKYSTGPRGDRLDEVRFWLMGSDMRRQYYNGLPPIKKDELSQDTEEPYLLITVENLPAGPYTYGWEIPNKDNLFELPNVSEIEVTKNLPTEITQRFVPHYGGVDASIIFGSGKDYAKTLPEIRLRDEKGTIVRQSADGKLSFNDILPGNYVVDFADHAYFYPPKNVPITVVAAKTSGPVVGEYQLARGTLVVSYDTGPAAERLDRVRFWVIDQEGNRTMYPKQGEYSEDADKNMRVVTVNNLWVGAYRIEMILPNQDNLFSQPESQTFTIGKDETVHLDLSVNPNYAVARASYTIEDVPSAPTELPGIRLVDNFGETRYKSNGPELIAERLPPGEYQILFPEIPGFNTPDPVAFQAVPNGQSGPFLKHYTLFEIDVAIQVNNELADWVIYQNGNPIKRGQGTQSAIRLPPGEGYYIETEQIAGFNSEISPSRTFSIHKEPLILTITYAEKLGSIALKAPIADKEIVTVVMEPLDTERATTIRQSVGGEGGYVEWHSDAIPVGKYKLTYELPHYYTTVAEQNIEISEDQPVQLTPEFRSKRVLTVEANVPEATYRLRSVAQGWERSGKGANFTFDNLLPGRYEVAFDQIPRDLQLPPKPIQAIVTDLEDAHVTGNYQRTASLVVTSNVDVFPLRLVPSDAQWETQEVQVTGASYTFRVPEGHYRLEFGSLAGELAARFGDNHPDPADVYLTFSKPERVHVLYEANRGSLVVTSNLAGAAYTVRDVTDGEGLVIGRFRGEYQAIPLSYVGEFEIVFEDIPNYTTPETVRVTIRPDSRETVGGSYIPLQKVVEIPAGPAIVGDVFGEGSEDEKPSRTVDLDSYAIGIYLVTNAEYAVWLNSAVESGKAVFLREPGVKGQIKDQQGRLLFETNEADKDSQIAVKYTPKGLMFVPVAGKEDHPVVEVSWYGAQAYCQDKSLRMPTEAEWEKAAGMRPPEQGGNLRKFRYGTGSDSINPTQANYLESYKAGHSAAVRTTQVGYYNGVHLLQDSTRNTASAGSNAATLTAQYGTNVAKSPYGLYDASGNVREWIADWYDADALKTMADRNPTGPGHGTRKVTKGGCYDSFAYELRVSARRPLPPDTTDAYTGFRVVMSQR